MNPVVKYEILFDIDSLMGTTSDPVKYEGIENTTYKESSIKPPQVTSLPGYKFLDWEPEFDPYDIIIGDKTFKAKFEEITACVPAKIKNIVATPLGNNGYKFDISFTKPVTLFETSKFWAEEWPSTTQTNWQNSYNGNIHKGNGLKLLVVFKDECDNVFEIDYNYLRPYMDK